jgi:MATE family multidrug resistance protein
MRQELRALARLASPIVVAEMGWLAMGIVDTIMVGPLGPAAIGAVGTGTILFLAIMMPGFGTLLALDTFVAQSYGAGRIDDCHRWLFAGLQLAAAMGVVLSAAAFAAVRLLPAADLHPEVLAHITPYMTHLVWSAPPLFFFVVFRRYLQALHIVHPVMTGLVTANLVNIAVNWVLIYGRLGAPALGVVGAAYATVASRAYLALYLLVVIWRRERRRPSGLHDVPLALDLPRIRQILTVGAPAAGQILLEVGVFAAASALAGRIAPAAVAAHQIVLNIIGFVFMLPYGIGTAAAVRVGHAIGRGEPAAARRAGWAAVGTTIVIMAGAALLFATAPVPLIRLFSDDAGVLTIGTRLLLIAAVFQLFDGLQTVTTGALRGLGDTRTPMVWNLAGHWAIGLPAAYFLCFRVGWGVEGLWAGLAVGILLIGSVLVVAWHRRSAAPTSEARADIETGAI